MEPTEERACAKCDGSVVDAKFVAFMDSGALVLSDNPLFRRKWSRLRAVTCVRCGYAEFYATSPAQLASGRPAQPI